MLKTTLLASALAALLWAPSAASAGDRGGHRGHFVRSPKVVIVLPHRPFVFNHHVRGWHGKPSFWHRPAPRHVHVWRSGPPPRAHWDRDDRNDHRRWARHDDRRWARHDDRRRHDRGHDGRGRDRGRD